jgi:hypothetical protein
MRQLNDYAETLPEAQKVILDSNHAAFNQMFDRFAEANRASTPAPQPGPGREAIERILRSKELSKDSARGERPGVMRGNRASLMEVRPTGKEAEISGLKKAIRMAPSDMDLATALAKHYVGDL